MSVVDHLRPAGISELTALEELQLSASLVWEEDRADLLAHRDVVKIPVEVARDDCVWVAVGTAGMIGFSVLVPLSYDVCELDGIFVEPAFMGMGVGRVLLRDAVARARRDGLKRIEVTANSNTVGFYEKFGFVPDGSVLTRFGSARRMHLDISE